MNQKNEELSDMLYSNKTENIDNSNRILGLKNEYKAYQCEAINESTKHLMNVIMPLELNLFVNKYLKFSNLNSFNSLDNLFEKVTENEYM